METVSRSGLLLWDWTALKSVRSGPVPVPRSGPASLPLSAPALVLQQPLSPVSPCSHHAATLITDPAITTLAAINLFCYATIPTTKALASYATTSVATILASYAIISITIITTDAQPR